MSLPHKETMTVGMDRPYNASFHKMLRMFTLTLLTAFVGTYVGMQFVPPAFMLPLVVIELVMLVSAMFIRRRGRAIGYPFVFAFCFISGITLFPAINYYLALGGAAIINTAFILTTVIFAGLTVYAYYSKRDFSFLRGFLMVALLALIGFALVGLFVPGLNAGTVGLVVGRQTSPVHQRRATAPLASVLQHAGRRHRGHLHDHAQPVSSRHPAPLNGRNCRAHTPNAAPPANPQGRWQSRCRT